MCVCVSVYFCCIFKRLMVPVLFVTHTRNRANTYFDVIPPHDSTFFGVIDKQRKFIYKVKKKSVTQQNQYKCISCHLFLIVIRCMCLIFLHILLAFFLVCFFRFRYARSKNIRTVSFNKYCILVCALNKTHITYRAE